MPASIDSHINQDSNALLRAAWVGLLQSFTSLAHLEVKSCHLLVVALALDDVNLTTPDDGVEARSKTMMLCRTLQLRVGFGNARSTQHAQQLLRLVRQFRLQAGVRNAIMGHRDVLHGKAIEHHHDLRRVILRASVLNHHAMSTMCNEHLGHNLEYLA
eukprot:5238845-Pleurochrysis_carterae.AAC.2